MKSIEMNEIYALKLDQVCCLVYDLCVYTHGNET